MLKLGVMAVCLMNNFATLPPKIKGEVVIELKNYITIAVKSKDKKEVVELTFPKSKCTKEENKINKSILRSHFDPCRTDGSIIPHCTKYNKD